jgi:ABC-2 type transport system ATP-binding protein
MFLSIHQIADAARVCDRFVLLSGGRVCGEGTLPELCNLAATRGVPVAGDDLEEVFLALT